MGALPAPVGAPIIPGGNEKPAAIPGRSRGRWDRVMSSERIYPVPASLARSAWCDEASYFEMYRHSIEDADAFWAEQAKRLDWIEPLAAADDPEALFGYNRNNKLVFQAIDRLISR